MALVSTAAVRAGNGLGGKTHIASVATNTITVAAACTALAEAGFTIAGVEGTADGSHIAVQGTADYPTLAGTSLVATFVD